MNEDKTTIVIGMLNDETYAKMHDIGRRVYDIKGIAPTIHTCGGGNLEPKIMVYEKKSSKHADDS